MEEKSFFQIYKETMTINYSNFEGRARRREYWGFVLINILVYMGLGFVLGFLAVSKVDALLYIGIGIIGVYLLATFIPSLAIAIRRLHDTNKSGWFYLIVLIPYIGSFVLLIFFCIEGTRGPNNYGLDPKDPITNEIEEIGQEIL